MNLKKGPLVVVGIAVVALAAMSVFVHYYGDWLWFENLGFAQVFTTILWAKALTFAAFALVFGLFAAVNLFIARRHGSYSRTMRIVPHDGQATPIDLLFSEAHATQVWTLAVLFLSGLMGISASGSWMTFLQYLHHSQFGVADPIFSKDAGFYVFILPLYTFLQKWCLTALLLVFMAVGFSYYLDHAVMFKKTHSIFFPR